LKAFYQVEGGKSFESPSFKVLVLNSLDANETVEFLEA